MSYIPKTISEVVLEYINKTTFLPAIQREYVWETEGIEKLFDSIMGAYPISSFLFWSDFSVFPFEALNKKLNVEPNFSDTEIENLLATNYSTKYSYLILSLLYPDRDWKDNIYHEDHIFPKSEFTSRSLAKRGYDAGKILDYQKHYNTIVNLQLLTDSENLEKNATPFDVWLPTRDGNFIKRHSIPKLSNYLFDNFLEFAEKRSAEIKRRLTTISM